jgi:hypothetical protein
MKPSPASVENGFRVRLMSPLGSYPADSFITPSAALVVDPEICFTLVRGKRKKKDDWSYSEIDNLDPSEIPLLGSILLSVEAGDLYVYPYPAYRLLLLKSPPTKQLSEKSISGCKSRLLDHLKGPHVSWPTDAIHKPRALGGAPYTLVPGRRSDTMRLAILRGLETASPVLIRGVSCLVKAHMAWKHPEFMEAACIYLWIALDAAFSLTLRKLRETGLTNPTAADAANYVDKIFGHETPWDKFFEHDYYNRISVIHPDNRHGAEARPSLLADDFLDLNDSLIPLFQHIVLNY